jgi:hypothetical protein
LIPSVHTTINTLYNNLIVYWSSIILEFFVDINTKNKESIGIYKNVYLSDWTYVCCCNGFINFGNDKYVS